MREFPTDPKGWRGFRVQNDERPALGVFFEGYIDEGHSEVTLSKTLGVSRTFIQQHRALSRALPAVQASLVNSDILWEHARAIAEQCEHNDAAQEAALAWLLAQLADGRKVIEDDVDAYIQGTLGIRPAPKKWRSSGTPARGRRARSSADR